MYLMICNVFIYHEYIDHDVNELFVMNLFITKYSTILINFCNKEYIQRC